MGVVVGRPVVVEAGHAYTVHLGATHGVMTVLKRKVSVNAQSCLRQGATPLGKTHSKCLALLLKRRDTRVLYSSLEYSVRVSKVLRARGRMRAVLES